jgi:hypothetical protein
MDTRRRPASFLTQANALLRKNLCLQAPFRFSPSRLFVCFYLFCFCFLDALLWVCSPSACEYACTVLGVAMGGSSVENARQSGLF